MSASSFPKQFVVCHASSQVPNRWCRDTVDGWTVAHAPDLPRIRVITSDGRKLGILLGWVMFEGRILSNGDAITVSNGFSNAMDWLSDMRGRYVAIVQNYKRPWFFLDPSGSLSAVYSPQHRMICSTTGLVPNTKGCEDDMDLIKLFDIPREDRWYPFGLTPRCHVYRLLPNHALELDTFRAKRVWPTQSIPTYNQRETEKIRTAIEAIWRRLRENVEVFSLLPDAIVNLTAGRDTRMLLAASKRVCHRIEFMTNKLPDKVAALDCFVARALAEHFKLSHQVVEFVDPDPIDLKKWLDRTGHCVAGRIWQGASTIKGTEAGRFVLNGLGAEVGRAYYWKKHDLEGQQVTPTDLLARLGAPISAKTLSSAETWLANLPKGPVTWVLDLAYIEQRLGAWAGPSLYGHDGAPISVFNDRRIFEAMLLLPTKYRFEQMLSDDLIKYSWRELLEFPINRTFGLKGVRSYGLKGLKHARIGLRGEVSDFWRILRWVMTRPTRLMRILLGPK